MESPGESGAGSPGAPSPSSFTTGHLAREKPAQDPLYDVPNACHPLLPAPPPSSLSGSQQWLHLQDPGRAPRSLDCHPEPALCHQVPSDPAQHFWPLPVQGAGLPPPAPWGPGPQAAHHWLPRLPPGGVA
uniref:Ras and Rab interactor 1 isoform 3 n=1 Tax=Homo sapiens TaxID=9606 RepID=A0A0S2Z4T3_HUMAN|nr:Ras and Rab interactor 1 isoform 3 [Homo sapiens]